MLSTCTISSGYSWMHQFQPVVRLHFFLEFSLSFIRGTCGKNMYRNYLFVCFVLFGSLRAPCWLCNMGHHGQGKHR
jgi:hypothetical protein